MTSSTSASQRKRQFQLFAYVILENHLHLIAQAPYFSEVMRHRRRPRVS